MADADAAQGIGLSASGIRDEPGHDLPPAYRLVALDVVDSTNEEAKRRAAAGAEDGTLVWAGEQTGGRGRHGRHWESPAGNLYLSLLLRPDCAPAEALQLGFVAALGLGAALGTILPPMTELRYKWPNDVLLNDQKVAGILMESATTAGGGLEWLIAGIGVNVASYPRETAFPATSLRAVGCGGSVEQVLEAFSRQFLTWAQRWLRQGFAPIRGAWLQHAWHLGEEVTVRLGDETLTGVFAELDETGALCLETSGGERRVVTYGDVFPPDAGTG